MGDQIIYRGQFSYKKAYAPGTTPNVRVFADKTKTEWWTVFVEQQWVQNNYSSAQIGLKLLPNHFSVVSLHHQRGKRSRMGLEQRLGCVMTFPTNWAGYMEKSMEESNWSYCIGSNTSRDVSLTWNVAQYPNVSVFVRDLETMPIMYCKTVSTQSELICAEYMVASFSWNTHN